MTDNTTTNSQPEIAEASASPAAINEKGPAQTDNEPAAAAATKSEDNAAIVDDEEDEDIDALIEELESQDANHEAEEEDVTQPGGAKPVPDELLQTDPHIGLTTEEIDKRRKKYGLNQMKEEKENMILKFLSYFKGPIQFVMEVSFMLHPGKILHGAIDALYYYETCTSPDYSRSIANFI